ncbi:protocatechuate 3,4-dioxygenase, alpha subunit [Jatrophihabitans endophyticus]|uniref:Protocatechuate 3,4-dioxygenase, alpha subunit n=1 Tax=Jatrophihabitans endophyticus TaxID=1206085 RepID=A0A1M5D7U5_9ACTN|nr:protocatechuate 3,4-dioxygenase subunit alpha [Jatrophihabitans endophyticus]SHF63021.1 protocatechuate 3,4-dioxygenase, alpha subunit [Jatrophihabitans endophyticus]
MTGADADRRLPPTPGQTVGPFFGIALPYDGGPDLVPADHPGAIRLHGRVLDGAGEGVPDALLELWQAGPDGAAVGAPGSLRRDGHTFTGWGRAATDGTGHYAFTTVVPGALDAAAPFFALTVFARGLLDALFTRVYLPGEAAATDPLLSAVDPDRRATLVAAPEPGGYVFDVVLQGGGDRPETVFLDHRPPR